MGTPSDIATIIATLPALIRELRAAIREVRQLTRTSSTQRPRKRLEANRKKPPHDDR